MFSLQAPRTTTVCSLPDSDAFNIPTHVTSGYATSSTSSNTYVACEITLEHCQKDQTSTREVTQHDEKGYQVH
ncbi:hypothetical protein CgunFtcFv8_020108 [Champsocephalus gunnari]|uniref:Uncharacterized protein n=1 Tax=Champsocephalus gunnari TaxID=52237 RepID=A0AAN8DJ57_CHAGU|nr:hypothetical protein CgunFtcFv8_020108 [Champsocephalus gunnari]